MSKIPFFRGRGALKIGIATDFGDEYFYLRYEDLSTGKISARSFDKIRSYEHYSMIHNKENLLDLIWKVRNLFHKMMIHLLSVKKKSRIYHMNLIRIDIFHFIWACNRRKS